MNQDPSPGNSFGQPSQQQTTPQPIYRSGLANPTKYHLAAKSQRQLSNGAPPTPNNSFQNNTLSSNSFSNNATVDPQLLRQYQQQQQQQHFMPIKHESVHVDYEDYDPTNAVMSPMSNTDCNSPQNHSFGSPPTSHNYEAVEESFGRSYKPPSHMDAMFGGGSTSSMSASSMPASTFYPNENFANESFTDNFPANDEYFAVDEIAMSAPTTSPIGPMDVKANINNTKVNYRSHPNNNSMNNLGHVSMSLPTIPNSGGDWFSTSLDTNFQPGSHSYANTGDVPVMASGSFEHVDNEAQKDVMAFEKRRRRRESHNAVERRRRDNINEKIHELSTLLPDLFVDSSNKPNKGVILRKSVDYIRHLQHIYEQERNRSSKLESQVRELKSGNPGSGPNNSPGGGGLYGSLP